LEVPDTDANLYAVGVGLAVVGGLDEGHLRLLCGWTHSLSRLPRLGRGWRGKREFQATLAARSSASVVN
jgi:hypothetical protein